MCSGDRKKGEKNGKKQKKVKQCRKDVGKGHEKDKRETRLVKERKAAVKDTEMEAKAGLMG